MKRAKQRPRTEAAAAGDEAPGAREKVRTVGCGVLKRAAGTRLDVQKNGKAAKRRSRGESSRPSASSGDQRAPNRGLTFWNRGNRACRLAEMALKARRLAKKEAKRLRPDVADRCPGEDADGQQLTDAELDGEARVHGCAAAVAPQPSLAEDRDADCADAYTAAASDTDDDIDDDDQEGNAPMDLVLAELNQIVEQADAVSEDWGGADDDSQETADSAARVVVAPHALGSAPPPARSEEPGFFLPDQHAANAPPATAEVVAPQPAAAPAPEGAPDVHRARHDLAGPSSQSAVGPEAVGRRSSANAPRPADAVQPQPFPVAPGAAGRPAASGGVTGVIDALVRGADRSAQGVGQLRSPARGGPAGGAPRDPELAQPLLSADQISDVPLMGGGTASHAVGAAGGPSSSHEGARRPSGIPRQSAAPTKRDVVLERPAGPLRGDGSQAAPPADGPDCADGVQRQATGRPASRTSGAAHVSADATTLARPAAGASAALVPTEQRDQAADDGAAAGPSRGDVLLDGTARNAEADRDAAAAARARVPAAERPAGAGRLPPPDAVDADESVAPPPEPAAVEEAPLEVEMLRPWYVGEGVPLNRLPADVANSREDWDDVFVNIWSPTAKYMCAWMVLMDFLVLPDELFIGQWPCNAVELLATSRRVFSSLDWTYYSQEFAVVCVASCYGVESDDASFTSVQEFVRDELLLCRSALLAGMRAYEASLRNMGHHPDAVVLARATRDAIQITFAADFDHPLRAYAFRMARPYSYDYQREGNNDRRNAQELVPAELVVFPTADDPPDDDVDFADEEEAVADDPPLDLPAADAPPADVGHGDVQPADAPADDALPADVAYPELESDGELERAEDVAAAADDPAGAAANRHDGAMAALDGLVDQLMYDPNRATSEGSVVAAAAQEPQHSEGEPAVSPSTHVPASVERAPATSAEPAQRAAADAALAEALSLPPATADALPEAHRLRLLGAKRICDLLNGAAPVERASLPALVHTTLVKVQQARMAARRPASVRAIALLYAAAPALREVDGGVRKRRSGGKPCGPRRGRAKSPDSAPAGPSRAPTANKAAAQPAIGAAFQREAEQRARAIAGDAATPVPTSVRPAAQRATDSERLLSGTRYKMTRKRVRASGTPSASPAAVASPASGAAAEFAEPSDPQQERCQDAAEAAQHLVVPAAMLPARSREEAGVAAGDELTPAGKRPRRDPSTADDARGRRSSRVSRQPARRSPYDSGSSSDDGDGISDDDPPSAGPSPSAAGRRSPSPEPSLARKRSGPRSVRRSRSLPNRLASDSPRGLGQPRTAAQTDPSIVEMELDICGGHHPPSPSAAQYLHPSARALALVHRLRVAVCVDGTSLMALVLEAFGRALVDPLGQGVRLTMLEQAAAEVGALSAAERGRTQSVASLALRLAPALELIDRLIDVTDNTEIGGTTLDAANVPDGQHGVRQGPCWFDSSPPARDLFVRLRALLESPLATDLFRYMLVTILWHCTEGLEQTVRGALFLLLGCHTRNKAAAPELFEVKGMLDSLATCLRSREIFTQLGSCGAQQFTSIPYPGLP